MVELNILLLNRKDIKKVVLQKKHFVFFDSAYQGFTSGDVVEDAYSLRLFAKD